MIPNVILVLNGKGGVLKTTVVANLAGLAAAGGWRVLTVDLDRQGNLGRDLGYLPKADSGEGLADAVMGRAPLTPIVGVRPNLDVVPGGPAIDGLVADLQRAVLGGNLTAADGLGHALADVAGNYDVILIDSPPGEALLHSAAIRAAHYILIPTQADAASIDGLGQVASIVARERNANPDLEVLGVILGPLPPGATAIEREARSELTDLLGDNIPIFDTVIRDAKRAAVDCRRRGELAHEYENAAASAEPWWKPLRNRKAAKADGGRVGEGTGPRFSSAASSLAGDYQALANEVFARFSERQAATSEPTGSGGGA